MTGTLNSKTATRAMIRRSLRAARSNLRKKHDQLVDMGELLREMRSLNADLNALNSRLRVEVEQSTARLAALEEAER